MNDPHDNAQADRDALERWNALDDGPQPPSVLAVPTDFDPESGELPWDGFRDGRIQNFLGLDWAGEKLTAIDKALADNAAAFDAEYARRVARFEALNAPLEKEREFWLNAIKSYAEEQGRQALCVGRAKSRTLPSGLTLKWQERREGTYRWDQSKTPAEREEAVLCWAREMELLRGTPLTREEERPDMDKIRRFLAELDKEPGEPIGRAPPGLEWVPPGESLVHIGIDTKEEP